MKTNYIKQAWTSLRQQPVVSIVSVAGTALAIFPDYARSDDRPGAV